MADILSTLLPKILEWKERYGTIYYLKAGSRSYIFRTLSMAEHGAILAVSSSIDKDMSDLLLELCLLYPEYDSNILDKELAGEVESVVMAIKQRSGFSEKDSVIADIDKAREVMGTLENQMVILICKAFPHLTLEDVDRLTYAELIKYIALSEAILDVKLNIEKPEDTKGGAVNFEEENKSFNEPPPFSNKNKHRGAPDK
jgi:hypothetical protein